MRKSIIIALSCIVVLAALIATKGFGLFGANGITGGVTGKAVDSVRIPLSEITTSAKWYEYDAGGTTVRFFVVRAGDGRIKTAFDACDVCYKFRKGYMQEGSFMICNNCGRKFAISGLGTENTGTGCWPGYLPSSIRGSELVISKSAIESGKWRFV